MDIQITLTHEEIEELCKAGGMAPSGGNTQPWFVEVTKTDLLLKLNPDRSTSFLDVDHFASYFGLGCFLENVMVKATALGLKYTIQIENFVLFDTPLVTIHFTKREKQLIEDSLEPFIDKRITNRHIYNGSIIDDKLIKNLTGNIINSEYGENYGIDMLSSYEDKENLAQILGKADAIRMTNDQAFGEMIDEFRWTNEEVKRTKDGLDLETLELPKNVGKLYFLLKEYDFLRKILPKKALQDIAKPLLLGCSHLCCMHVSSPLSPRKMIIAGVLFERLWLTATKLGIALQPWSVTTYFLIRKNMYAGNGFNREEIITLDHIEHDLSKFFGYSSRRIPVMIFRLSFTDRAPSAHSLRRSWQEFVKIR